MQQSITQIAIRRACELLSTSKDATEKLNACGLLKAWAFEDANMERLRDSNAIATLIEALHAESWTGPTSQTAADAIWSLSCDPANHPIMLRAGAVPLLAQLLFAASTALVSTAASTLVNLVDLESGLPGALAQDVLDAGGIAGLVELLRESVHYEAPLETSEPTQAVVAVVAALAADPAVGDEIRVHGGVPRLVALLRGGARNEVSRHAAAAIARMAYNNAATQSAVREAGGIQPLIALAEDALDGWALSRDDEQAAQHATGALWVLAADPICKQEMLASRHGLKALATIAGGRAGPKAEGNAAGALLAIMHKDEGSNDPVTVLTAVGGFEPAKFIFEEASIESSADVQRAE